MQFCNILLTLAIVTAALYIQNGIHSQLDRVVFNATLHRAVPLLVGCVFQRRSPAEIAERGVGWVAIQMPALHAIGTRAQAPIITDFYSPAAKEFFQAVTQGLDALHISYQVTPHLVRGLPSLKRENTLASFVT